MQGTAMRKRKRKRRKNIDTSLLPGRFWFNHVGYGSFEQRYIDRHGELVEDSVVARYRRACKLDRHYKHTRELIASRVSEDIAEALGIPPLESVTLAMAPQVVPEPDSDLDAALAATWALLEKYDLESDFGYGQEAVGAR